MDTISKAWDWTKNDQDFWYEPSEISYYLLNRWKRNGFTRLLDLGCGVGRHSYLFAENGFSVDAFDFSESAIGEVKRNVEEKKYAIRALQGDMNDLPYADCSFDCLLAYHVISHTDTNGIKKIIGEINRALKNGGEFYVTLCSKNSWSYQKAGYPKHDENTIIKTEEGPEKGIPHFYSSEDTVKDLFKGNTMVTIQHIQDVVLNGGGLKDSWHYFILGKKE